MRISPKTALAAVAVLATSQPALAQTVVRAGDDALTCTQIADEAATISADMGERGPGLLGRAAGVARAGASLLVPGAGLAMAGAEALTGSNGEKKEAAADARRDRWNYLNGLYAGRGCDQTSAQTSAQPAQTSAQGAAAVVAPVAASSAAAAAAPAVATPQPTITPAAFPHQAP